MSAWTLADMPDLHGSTYVVTGASSGIGLVTARELAAHGAYVVLAVRDTVKGEAVRADMPADVRERTEVRRIDLADLDTVREFAAGVSDWRIEGLVNNAGIVATRYERTAQGFESQFGTNVLGPFLLTQLLLGQGNIADRVVWVSSGAHRAGGLDLGDLDWGKRRFAALQAYGASKLADLMLAYEQQRRFTREHSTLRSIAAHPGYSATNLFRSAPPPARRVVSALARIPYVGQDAEAGALPLLYAASVVDVPGGAYIGPSGPLEVTGAPRPVGSSAQSHDRELAADLWATCERLTTPAA